MVNNRECGGIMDETGVIERIEFETIKEDLQHPFVTALHEVRYVIAVRVRIILKNGLVGLGSATPNDKVTGDTLESMSYVMKNVIKSKIIGLNITNWDYVLQIIRESIADNSPAKAAFEIALYDLRAQLFQMSLSRLLGGIPRNLYTDYTVSLAPLSEMVEESCELVKRGFNALKIKLGDHDFEEDVQLILDIAKVIPNAVSLRIDINQAWTVSETLSAVDTWTKHSVNIDFIEQPVKADNYSGMRQITQCSKLPVMADESVHTFEDARELIANHACDLVNIKLMKTGGISQAERINQLCEMAGIQCMIGCMIESRESIAAAVAFATAHRNVKYVDLDSVFMSRSKRKGGFESEKNMLRVTEKAGLGF
ncbi:dipeptide epimerase [Liquorilactobacillus mali]|nr:dipeptide epimerase [Liquorilactobacillus mali]